MMDREIAAELAAANATIVKLREAMALKLHAGFASCEVNGHRIYSSQAGAEAIVALLVELDAANERIRELERR